MTEKRYYCDDKTEYRSYGIFDLSKADKTMDDFRDEDGICSWQFNNYLVDETDSMLTGDEVCDLLNEQDNEIQRCKLAYNQLASYVDANFDEYMTQEKLNERIRELEKENQELKKKVESMAKELYNCEEDYIYEEYY